MKIKAAEISEFDVVLWKGLLNVWGCDDVANLIDHDRKALVTGRVDVATDDDLFP